MFRLTYFVTLVASLLVSATASASPWTLRRGEIAFVAGYDYQFAGQEFLERGTRQNFPLRGRYAASSLNLGARAGFTDRLEFELQLPIKLVSYSSDSVILLPDAMPGPMSFDYYQQNIIDLSRTRQGIGDIWITGRYNLLRWPLALAIEGRLKTPTGYDGPEGTFGTDPANQEDFLANAATLVTPENVRDDVALGDGQVDLNLNVLLGASFPTRTFVRLDAGYNLRFGAGDQVLASFKVGQAIGSRVLVYADARFAYTVTEGPLIGISVAAIDPDLPAADYGGLDNLRIRELRLERDALDLSIGGIIRINEQSELNIGYARTVWGRNTAAVNAFFISVGVRTDVSLPDSAAASEPEIVEAEEEYVEEPADVAEDLEASPVAPAEPEPGTSSIPSSSSSAVSTPTSSEQQPGARAVRPASRPSESSGDGYDEIEARLEAPR